MYTPPSPFAPSINFLDSLGFEAGKSQFHVNSASGQSGLTLPEAIKPTISMVIQINRKTLQKLDINYYLKKVTFPVLIIIIT